MPDEMDIITTANGQIGGSGSVAQMLLQSVDSNGHFNVNALRTNDSLRKDEWKHFDSALVNVARERLVMTGELISRGLVMSLPNALGTTVLEWEKVNDLGAAEITMSGLTRTPNEGLDFVIESMPIPIIHKDFQLNIRHLNASRQGASRLDTTQLAIAGRKVSDQIEGLIFNGVQVLATNGRIWGLLNHPNRVTGSVTASWATTTGENMVTDVLRMMDALVAKNQFGPYLLIVPTAVGTRMGNDYKANSDKTIAQRISEIQGLSGIVSTNRLSGTNILLVSLSAETIQMIDGLQPTVVQWGSQGGFVMNFKVMAIMLPRIRADYLAQSGIAHYS